MALSRRQFDQLGAHPRADRLLLHRRGRARRARVARVSFAVPTGNFGDVLAGWYAKRMGLPIERLIVATNENDILARALASGEYRPAGVKPTQSPSMDIQVSSNFERLLFERLGRDAERLRGLMASAASSPAASPFRDDALAAIRAEFDAVRCSEAECASEMARAWRESGVLLDPHTRDRRPRRARGAAARSRDAGHRAGDRPSRQIPRRGGEGDRRAARRCRRISPISCASRSASTRAAQRRRAPSPIISAPTRGRGH